MGPSENESSHRSGDSPQKSRSKRGKETNGDSTQRRENGEGSTTSTSNTTITRPPGVSGLHQHKFEEGLNALTQISGILNYASRYKGFVEDADQLFGHCIRQDEKVEELKSQLKVMTFFATSEVEKLSEENARYKREYEQLRKDRTELDDAKANMQRDLQTKRSRLEEEAAEAQSKQSEKLQLALSNDKKKFESHVQKQTKKANDEHKKQVSELQSEIEKLKKLQVDIEKDKEDSERILNEKIESLECDHRSSRSRIFQLEAELERMKPLAPFSPKTADF